MAAGLAPWAIGTDTGGSIRQPASLCGIVGLKPTYGAVSRYGMIAFASSLDQAGPLTRDVTDAALLFRHMVGKDAVRLHLHRASRRRSGCPTPSAWTGCAFGVPPELTGEGVEPGVKEVFDATLKLIEELGGELIEVGLPHSPHGIAAYYVIAPAEASANLARFDGVRYGPRKGDGDLLSLYEETRAEGFGDEVKRRIMLGTYALSSGYYDAYYGTAQKVRTKIADDFRAAFEQVDLIVTPTSAHRRLRPGRAHRGPAGDVPVRRLTVPMPLAGHPGDLDPRRPVRRAAGGHPAGGPGVQREPHPRRRPRARGGDRLRRERRACLT